MSGQTFFRLRESLVEKTLTAAEKRKREEVAKAIARDQPGMAKSMKMAIATATAKRVAEDAVSDYTAKGGRVITAPYKKPRKAEKTDYSSKHIGGKGEHKSGKAANTTSPRPVGEETEQIDELRKTTIASYIKKASSSSHPNSASNLASRAAHKLATSSDDDDGEKEDHKSFNRSKNIAKAVDRLNREEIEDHSDPLSEEEYDRIRDMYGKGAARGMMNSRWNPHHPEFYGKKRSTSSPSSSSSSSSSDKHYHKVPFAQKDDAKKEGMRWDSGAKKWYHSSASASTASKFQKEEVEEVNELKKSTLASYTGKVVDPVYGMPRSTKKIKQRLAGLQRAHQRAIGKKPTSEEVNIEEELDFKKEAAKHMKDLHSASSTPANKAYAQKMLKRALEASKMKDKTAAHKHYTMAEETVEEASKTPGKDWRMAAREAIKKKLPYSTTGLSNYTAAKKAAVKEQVAQVDEYSTEYLASYKKAAGASARAADQKGDYKKGNKRFKGILAATRKQFKNEAGKK